MWESPGFGSADPGSGSARLAQQIKPALPEGGAPCRRPEDRSDCYECCQLKLDADIQLCLWGTGGNEACLEEAYHNYDLCTTQCDIDFPY